jgi:hypothetical protein
MNVEVHAVASCFQQMNTKCQQGISCYNGYSYVLTNFIYALFVGNFGYSNSTASNDKKISVY